MRIYFSLFGLLLIGLNGLCYSQDPQKQATSSEIEFFEKKIRPILAERCYSCHSKDAKTIQGGLRLDSSHSILKGGDSGLTVVPGKPGESLFIESIQFDSDADFQMPPAGKLPQTEIALLTDWVRRGAHLPDSSNETLQLENKIDFAQARKFWSYIAAKQQPLPRVGQPEWPRSRIDRFVLSAMESQGLRPSAEASRATLIRRVTFDLIGVPPTSAEVDSFERDLSPQAYEALVDRLLNDPRFGERWARVWLDLARYTDRNADWLKSTGQAHLYRDWVVNAMNNDLPYDDFIHRQLATDFMPSTGPEDMPALGFLGLSPNYWKELKLPKEIIKVIVADEWEERIDTVSRSFLGLTVACARCHDHKFDAITMHDYYAMAGVFASCRIQERPVIRNDLFEPVRKAKLKIKELEAKLKELKKKQPNPAKEIQSITTQINRLRRTPFFHSPMAPAIVDESVTVLRKGPAAQSGTKLVYKPEPQDLPLFLRGNPNRVGEVVPRRFLTVLSPTDHPETFKQGSGRLELAQRITSDAKSLTARVMVNRIWLAHFGRGIVTTPSNFGRSGDAPTHPKLLDDLAARFLKQNWSLKSLHREIVLSATYRQSSRKDSFRQDLDPNNIWLSRMNRTRLPIEAWRDAMLSVSGELEKRIGGKSIALNLISNRKRTLYGTIHRREMSSMLLTHDFPDPTAHSPKRVATTTTLQGLYALNGPMIMARAEALAMRVLKESVESDHQRVEFIYKLLFARAPTQSEIQLSKQFLSSFDQQQQIESWTQYAQVLLASNEFLFVN